MMITMQSYRSRASCGGLCDIQRLNQDSIDSTFGYICQVNGQNDYSNPTQFKHSYRKCSMTNLLKALDRGNCEPDADALLTAAITINVSSNGHLIRLAPTFRL